MKYLSLAIAIFLVSCKSSLQKDPSLKPDSVGALDEILVLMDKVHWEGEMGDSLRKYYTQDFAVIPQPEPIFNVYHREVKDFKDILIKYRNILVVGDLQGNTPASKYILEKLGEENRQQMLAGLKPYYFERTDVFAKPQTFRFITGANKKGVLETIKKSFNKVKAAIDEQEIEIQRKRIFAFGNNVKVKTKVREKFRIQLETPSDYVIAVDDDSVMWLRQDTKDITNNILIYAISYDPATMSGENLKTLPIRLRNAIGKKYVEGPTPQAYLGTELRVPYVQTNKDLSGRYSLVTRGLWKMENDYMGGAFINYLIYDEPNNRMIMLDGFVYAPGEKKRKLMRNMEAILSTVKL